MSNHYDVIIIGTGAGGGTLFHRLAPSGKRILLLERGDYVPRETDNWSTRAVNVEGRYQTQGALARRATGKDAPSRTRTTTWAATPSSTARRCSGSGARTSASSGTTAACRRPGRSATTSSSPTTPRPSTSTRCTASAARTRPSPPASAPYPHPAVSHEPRIQQLQRRPGPARAAGRSTCRSASCSTSGTRRQSQCIRCATCDGHPCLVQAKSDAQVVCVDPALAAPERHAADRRLRVAARDQRLRAAR